MFFFFIKKYNLKKRLYFLTWKINSPFKINNKRYEGYNVSLCCYEIKSSFYFFSLKKKKENEKINLKSYLRAAGEYRVTHFLIFTSTKKSIFFFLFI